MRIYSFKKIGFLLAGILLLTSTAGCASTNSYTAAGSAGVIAAGETVMSEASVKSSANLNTDAVTGMLEKRSMNTGEAEHLQYWLYTPKDPAPDMPLIVYLHGASGKGDNPDLLMANEDFPAYLQNGNFGDLRAYVIMPQLQASMKGWSDISNSIYSLIQNTVSEFAIDESNISLTGFSIGGTGTWNLAALYPSLFARIAPIAGSARGVLKQASSMKNISVWAFAGSSDTVISPNSSNEMVSELNKAGCDAKLTMFDGADHVSVPGLTWIDNTLKLTDWLTKSVKNDSAKAIKASKSLKDSKASANDGMNMYSNSDFIEKEQPELTDETKKLISLYQRNSTLENYLNLRDMVIQNYNAVLDRKETKLAELKQETAGKPGGDEIVAEMEEIVQEMYITYWNRINSSMLRFTDTRLLKWKISDAPQYDYIPVMGAGESIYVKRTPVTNAEYAAFIKETGYPAPSNWTDGSYPTGQDSLPVNYVSYDDAVAYCDWLTKKDGTNTYRLPNESEWELAAGHMPKDADFNCGVNNGRTSVEKYASVTRGAHGAIDFWGNVWEWTSTVRSTGSTSTLGVKGGAWNSDRTDCRTEYRDEARNSASGYEDVGFRVIQVLNGAEPAQKVELATLDTPVVSASATADSITLSWSPVNKAVEYQIFEYHTDTGLLYMLDRTGNTSFTVSGIENGSTHSYIVQPISYVEIADNVSPENCVTATCR